MIATAPAVWGGDQLNPFYRATLWLADHVAPGLKLTGKNLGILASDNLDVLQALSADPLFIKETRVDAIAGLVRLMDLAYTSAPALPGPLLVLGGARDEVVPPKAHAAMLERLTADPCTEIVYPDGWHLLLRDLERRRVWADILAWIDGRPMPSGLAKPCGGSLRVAAAGLGDRARCPARVARRRPKPRPPARRAPPPERLRSRAGADRSPRNDAAPGARPARPGTFLQILCARSSASPARKSIET